MHSLLFLACIAFVVISGSGSALGVTEPSTANGLSCSQNFNTIFDLAITRYSSKFDPVLLPDISQSKVKLIRPTVTGLSTAFRSCIVRITIDPATKNIELKLCITIKQATLSALAKLNMWFTTASSDVKVHIKNLDVQVKATAPIKKGGPVVVNELTIVDIGKLELDSTGVVGLAEPLVNGIFKNQIKGLIINMINKQMSPVINKVLKKYPL